MLNKEFLEKEKTVVGDIWQNSEILPNMLVLADDIGSRFCGTPSEKKAQEYILDKLKGYGYENARREFFEYFGWERGPVSLETTYPETREFYAISLAMSPGGEIEGEVVDLKTGSPEEFQSIEASDVEGKIVMCSSATSPSGRRVHRRTKYGYAIKYGALGFIFINHNPGQLPPTGSLRPAYKMGGEIPGIGVSLETGCHMKRLSKGGSLNVKIRDESRVIPKSESANIVCELASKCKTNEWIAIGGHYDGHDISQGAMDNLSGTAVTMELARALKPYEGVFDRNIRFICFSCEELGVTGSTNYVSQHEDEMKNIVLMLNLELGGLAYRDGTQHPAFTVYQPKKIVEYLESFGEDIHYPLQVIEDTSAASDHWPFYMKGVPTIQLQAEPSLQQFIVGRGWGHTSADTMDKVDVRNLNEGAMVAARLIFRLATEKEKIFERTSTEAIIEHLENIGLKKILEIQKKWHPNK